LFIEEVSDVVTFFLTDLYVERMRFEAMKCMSRSYRPTVPVGYVAQILGFLRTDSEGCMADGDDGLEECEKWLKAHGTVLSVDNSGELQIDMKVLFLCNEFFVLIKYS